MGVIRCLLCCVFVFFVMCVYIMDTFAFLIFMCLSSFDRERGIPLRVRVKVPTSNPMAHRIVLWCSGKIYISGVNGIQQYALNDLHVPVFRTAASWGESGGSRVPWQPLSV